MKKNNLEPNVTEKIRAKNRRLLAQDVGLLVFLAGILAAALLVAFSPSEALRMENLLMFLVLSGATVLAAYRFRYLAIALCAIQTCFYAAYRIYIGFTTGQAVPLSCYGWLALPVLTVGAMTVFMHSTYQAEVIAEMLEKQLVDQVMTDHVTGLYNLKSLYIDVERQIAYSKRNHLCLSLMLLELRYKDELTSILSSSQFDTLRVIFAELVADNIRLEDRLYALDDEGKLGIMCTCDRTGAQIMKGRIEEALEKTTKFREVLGRALRVEVRTGIFEYQEGLVENAIDLKKKAENEMQYDV